MNVDLGCVRFDVLPAGGVTVPDAAYLGSGRSYIAIWERWRLGAVVDIDASDDVTITKARLDALSNDGWVHGGVIGALNTTGAFVVAASNLGKRSARLCFTELSEDVACVLLPSRS